MKNSFLPLLLSLSFAISGCSKEDTILDPIPSADPANNVCVITQRLGPTDELSEACGSKDYLPEWTVTSTLNNMAAAMTNGTNGTRYKVLDKGWRKVSQVGCSSGFTYLETADIWVKYDCRGVAVNVEVYGPYPTSALTVKIQQHTADITSRGFKIAYVAQDRVGYDSNLYYLSFFIYTEDFANKNQAAVVSALQGARTVNTLTGNSNRPLSDTLNTIARINPSVDKMKDFQSAEALIKTIDAIRAQRRPTQR